MWFKNLQLYRLSTEWPITLEALRDQLAKKRFQPCGSQDMESRGWASPTGDDVLAHAVGGQWLICLQTESKLLPSSVVKQKADELAEKLEIQNGFKVGRKAMKDLREQITSELLPRAFTKIRKTFAWIDPINGWLVIDASSPARAEDVLEFLRQTLDTFPMAVLRTERSPTSAMADWLAANEAPDGFTIDQDCNLRSVTEERKEVTYKRGLDDEQIRAHLEAGKLPTRLALTFDDRISFVLTEKLEIKRLDFLDLVRDQAADAEDAAALFDAELALMTGELQRLLPAVVEALGGELKREPDLVDLAKEAA